MEEHGYATRVKTSESPLWKGGRPLIGRLDMELTERCNNNCAHCYINLPANDEAAKARELSTGEIQDILLEAVSLGCLTVRFTGGEPLLRDDFETLYLFARRLGLKVLLFTNATLITPHLADLFARIPAGDLPELRLVVKADVQGSLEALLSSIPKQATEEVRVEVLHSGVGGITEADVLLAEASNAVVLGFRVVPDQRAKALAEEKGVDIRLYTVIYQLLEDLEQAVKGLLAPTLVEEVAGRAEVRRVFKISRVGTVAGCYVTEGVITRGSQIRIIRDNVVVEAERQVESLRREKDDVREVRAGMECGLKVAGYDDVKEGDVIEAYRMVEVAR